MSGSLGGGDPGGISRTARLQSRISHSEADPGPCMQLTRRARDGMGRLREMDRRERESETDRESL